MPNFLNETVQNKLQRPHSGPFNRIRAFWRAEDSCLKRSRATRCRETFCGKRERRLLD